MDQIMEQIVQGIIEDEFVIIDNYLDDWHWQALQAQLTNRWQAGEFKAASIGKGVASSQNESVRSDQIKWIDRNDETQEEQIFLDKIQSLIAYLNTTCFTSLKNFEFHYAIYPPGTFYKKHLDQFSNDDARKFSVICYLNNDWVETDGGQLVLHLENRTAEILPKGGRMVCFQSHRIVHEVKAARRARMSITGWLKN